MSRCRGILKQGADEACYKFRKALITVQMTSQCHLNLLGACTHLGSIQFASGPRASCKRGNIAILTESCKQRRQAQYTLPLRAEAAEEQVKKELGSDGKAGSQA